MRRSLLQILKFVAFFSVGLLLLWFAFRDTDFNKLATELKEADYSWLFLSLFFGFMAYVSRARRWMLLIQPLGFRPSMLNTYHAVMIGYLANMALPRLGEISRCVALGKKEKIPVDQLFGTVIIERTIDLVMLLLIMTFLLFTSSDQIGLFLRDHILLPIQEKIQNIFGVTWALWAILLIIFLALFILLLRYRHSLRKIRFFAKIFAIGKGVINGLKSITSLENKWEFILHTLFIWFNYTMMTWVVVFSLGSTSHINFMESIFLLVIGGLAMSAPVQSGLGIFHYTISRGLAVIENVPLEDGLVYALLTHESQLIFVAVVGTISFFMMLRNKKNT